MSSKKALLVGINYIGSTNQLSGCINDMIQWWSLLQDVYGFEEKDIVFLRDDKSDFRPTKQRILQELRNLVNAKSEFSFIAFSCHGTQLPDINKDEQDNFDECIVPSDYRTGGIITDDELNAIMKNNTSKCLALFDCCHSGSMLDLPNILINTQNTPTNNIINKNQIICISSCRDNEVSAEVYNDINKLPQGALTITIIQNLRRQKYFPTIKLLTDAIQNDMKNAGLSQKIVISSQLPIYQDTVYPLINSLQVSSNAQLQQQLTTAQQQNISLQQQLTTIQQQITKLNKVASDNTQLLIINSNLNRQIINLQNQINNLNRQLKGRFIK